MNYDPNIYSGIHTVKITLQQWEYKGTVSLPIGGNAKGREILDCAMDFDAENFTSNDCSFEFFDYGEAEGFRCILKNDEGDELLIEDEIESLEQLIVAVEIVDFPSPVKE